MPEDIAPHIAVAASARVTPSAAPFRTLQGSLKHILQPDDGAHGIAFHDAIALPKCAVFCVDSAACNAAAQCMGILGLTAMWRLAPRSAPLPLCTPVLHTPATARMPPLPLYEKPSPPYRTRSSSFATLWLTASRSSSAWHHLTPLTSAPFSAHLHAVSVPSCRWPR
jgi:hypothetical protein